MTSLLEIREYIKSFYSRYSQIVTIAAKFVVTLIAVSMINNAVGYNETLTGTVPTLLVSLLSSLLPGGLICTILAFLILGHMWSLSLPVFAVAAVVFLLLFLLYFRFSPKDGLLIVITPICCQMGIPYALPLAAGLLFTPGSIVSIAFGLVIWFMLKYIHLNETSLTASGADEIKTVLTMLVNGIFRDPTMMVMIAAFGIAVAVVFFVRRLRISNSWLIASGAGALSMLIVLIVGGIRYDTDLNIGLALLGTLVGLLIAVVLTFFFFNLDYSRIESLQFEDDDYYYYVKAVPKVQVRTRERTVKTISRTFDRGSRDYQSDDRYENDGYAEDDDPEELDDTRSIYYESDGYTDELTDVGDSYQNNGRY